VFATDEVERVKENVIRQRGEKIRKAWDAWREFIQRFPFRERPDAIESLTPEDVYNPGSKEGFLYYLEHKLKHFGFIFVPGDAPWWSARDNLDMFKRLLRKAVDDGTPLWEKIDAEWESLRGWGGDKHYAKKVIFCYYPQEIIPVFKTEHLEHFVERLGLSDDLDIRARNLFQRSYEDLSTGQKYELLNGLLAEFKARSVNLRDLDNALFAFMLYEKYPPPEPITQPTQPRIPKPTSMARMLFSPVNELGVVALFAMYHRELGFPYILKIGSEFPDAVVIDKNGGVKKVEFELLASNFIAHNHDPDECDYIVCWENDLAEGEDERARELVRKVIALKERLGQIEE